MWYGGTGKREVFRPGGLWGLQGIAGTLFFVPFVLIGVAMLLMPAWAYVSAKRTVYVITDQRVLVSTSRRSGQTA
jgi:hypothetical protein